MSARDLLAARMLDDDGGVRVDRIGPDLVAAIAELDELAALKARRCDGCAHYAQQRGGVVPFGACRLAESHEDVEMVFSVMVSTVELFVDADHACNAWTAQEPT